MVYVVPLCLVAMCIILLIIGASVRLTVCATIVSTIAYILTQKTRRKSTKDKYTRHFIGRVRPWVFGGDQPSVDGLKALIDKSNYNNYYKRHKLFMETILPDYGKNINDTNTPLMSNTYIILPDKFEDLVAEFIRVCKPNFSIKYNYANKNKKVSQGKLSNVVTVVQKTIVIEKLMTRRSLVFNDKADEHITRHTTGRAGDITDTNHKDTSPYQSSADINIGKRHIGRVHSLMDSRRYTTVNKYSMKYPHQDYTLSYDEMLLSALCGMSAHTRFRNTGGRHNMGTPERIRMDCTINGVTINYDTYERDGILLGLVGERFEAEDCMGWLTMCGDAKSCENAVVWKVIGYIDKIDFEYGLDNSYFDKIFVDMNIYKIVCTKSKPLKDDNTASNISPKNEVTTSIILLKKGSTIINSTVEDLVNNTKTDTVSIAFNTKKINLTRFVKRLSIPMRMLLDDAVRRKSQTSFTDRQLYVVASGLGSGVWAKDTELGGDVIDTLNLYALISCMVDPKYKDIPIIEFRKYGHSTGVESYLTDGMSTLATKYKNKNITINHVVKQLDSIPEMQHVLVWEITHNNTTRNFVYRSYTSECWDNAVSVCSIYAKYKKLYENTPDETVNHDGTKKHETVKQCGTKETESIKSKLAYMMSMYANYIKPDSISSNTLVGIALLIAMFAWDSNSYVGNEFWRGEKHINASGDPAAVCCSDIGITMNPDFNNMLTYERANGKLCGALNITPAIGVN